MIRNKIKVEFLLEDGCSQGEGEVNSRWEPINFSIYSELFIGLITDAIDEWLSVNTVRKNVVYEVIFAHTIDQDAGGAILGEYFEPVHTETQSM